MTNETPTSSPEAEQAKNKKKMILVAVLSVGLVVALLTQPKPSDEYSENGSSSGVTSPSSAAPASAPATSGKSSQDNAPVNNQLVQIRHLSRMELDTITGLELFLQEPRQMRREGIKDVRRVDAIYASPTGHAALLGESIVRGGQPLPDGRRVLNVTAEGIEISY